MVRCAVVGNPVEHSRSPEIHQAFAAQVGLSLQYERLRAEAATFATTVEEFFRAGGRGLNVTVPFKGDAFSLVGGRSADGGSLPPRLQLAGAVNTLWREAGALRGENTDGPGLVADLRDNLGWPLRGRRVLVIGAGGAVQGVLGSLLALEPALLVVHNRTEERARLLVERFAPTAGGTVLQAVDATWQATRAVTSGPFDVVINGSSASLDGVAPDVPAAVVGSDSRCYDMAYAAAPTAFMVWAERLGAAAAVDGLGMLVEQAARSFAIWHGATVRTGEVLAALRA